MRVTSDSDAAAIVATREGKLAVTLDMQGRVRTSKEQRGVILSQFEQSGMSALQFAQRAGLKYSTFAGWVARYRRTKGTDRQAPVRLLEAVLAAPASTALQVQLPGGARLEIREASQIPLVVALVQTLEKSC